MSEFLDTLVKIKYTDEGYLPNLPPHLVSKEEMCDAFLHNDISYFGFNYICENEELEFAFELLKKSMEYHIENYTNIVKPVDLPLWVYSYMLGTAVCSSSDTKDRHDFLVALGMDNMDDIISPEVQKYCYNVSKAYCGKLTLEERELTVDGQTVLLRPPTMFGEPHVIKALRVGT